jgi:hypothetical protein
MTASFPRILPRYALGCYLGAAALLYLFAAQLLATVDIWLLPRRLLSPVLQLQSVQQIGTGMAELRYTVCKTQLPGN